MAAGPAMRYVKTFPTLEGLHLFLDFHKEETGLLFLSDAGLKAAWIEVDEKVYRELQHADRC